jgi:hypothetical protein
MVSAIPSTEGYRQYIRFILRMHRLTTEGKFESSEAEGAREEIDGLWDTLSAVEKKRLRGLSLDLKQLLKPGRNSDTQPEGGDKKESIVRALRHEGKLDEALEILRASHDEILAPSVSALRALIWFDFQEPDVAHEFYRDAMELHGSRVRSLVQSYSQELIRTFHETFKVSFRDVDEQVLEEFVREKIEQAGDRLTSILTEEQRRQRLAIDEVLRSAPASVRVASITSP